MDKIIWGGEDDENRIQRSGLGRLERNSNQGGKKKKERAKCKLIVAANQSS